MILKIDVVPVTDGQPKQQSAFFEGDLIIKTGVLIGDLDEIMKDNESAHMFAPKDIPESQDVGTIHFDIQRSDGSTDELIIAHCDAYLINDSGKTIDRFTCR